MAKWWTKNSCDLIYRAHTGGSASSLNSDDKSLLWSSFWRNSIAWFITSMAKCISWPLGMASFAEVCEVVIRFCNWAILRPYGFPLTLFVSINTLFSSEPFQKHPWEIKSVWFWKLVGSEVFSSGWSHQLKPLAVFVFIAGYWQRVGLEVIRAL